MEKIKAFIEAGDGYGSGDGYSDGSGCGWGDGSGDGYGIKSYAGKDVYLLDGVQTIIAAVHRNTAVGYILSDDLTLRRCYIAKGNGYFAHGDTLKGAVDALQEKIFETLDTDEKIGRFITEVDADKKYPAKFFYDWHHRLTGSCEMGRKDFAMRNGIDLDTDSVTVREFINPTENAYGGEIIRKVKERLYENNA